MEKGISMNQITKERSKIGLIGGSGIYQIEELETVCEHDLSTPYGKPSSPVIEAKIKGETCFFLPRHGKNTIYFPMRLIIGPIFMLSKF